MKEDYSGYGMRRKNEEGGSFSSKQSLQTELFVESYLKGEKPKGKPTPLKYCKKSSKRVLSSMEEDYRSLTPPKVKAPSM